MRITLAMEQMQFRQGRRTSDHREPLTSLLQMFRFHVRIVPAPDADSEIAEKAPYEPPPLLHPDRFGDLRRDCRRIVKRQPLCARVYKHP
jgi:hypothetical protein